LRSSRGVGRSDLNKEDDLGKKKGSVTGKKVRKEFLRGTLDRGAGS